MTRIDHFVPNLQRVPMFMDKGNTYTDHWNASRFVDHHKGHLIYVPGMGWHWWDGKSWVQDDGVAIECARATALSMVGQAASRVPNDQRRVEAIDFALRSQSGGRLREMKSMARDDYELQVESTALNPDPWLINTPGGIVDMRTGDVRSHDPAKLMTRITNGSYSIGQSWRGSRWDAFLRRNVPSEADRSYLQCWAGYSATGFLAAKEKAFLILLGQTDTGKNTFSEAIIHALGSYAGVIPTSIFVSLKSGRGHGHQEDIASSLPGKRLGVAAELNPGEVLAIAQLKALTGDETMSVSKKFGHAFEFHPIAKLWLHTNTMPKLYGADDAVENRLKIVHFDQRIPKTERDSTLGEALKAEADAVLSWIIDGALEYYRAGKLIEPDHIETEATHWIAQSNPFLMFLSECVMRVEGSWTNRKELYDAYRNWYLANDHDEKYIYRKMRFNTEIAGRGYEGTKRDGYDGWKDLELVPEYMQAKSA